MAGNELTHLFGGSGNVEPFGGRFSPPAARQVHREVEQVNVRKQIALAEVTARAEVEAAQLALRTARAAAVEQAESFLTSQRMSHAAMLHQQAAAHAQNSPTAGRDLAAILGGYVNGAVQRGTRGLG